MARTRYASDPGLIARMGITMFLLGVVFVGFAAGLVALIEWYGSVRHGGGGSSVSGSSIIIFAAIIGVGSALASYYWSDKIALRTSGASLVSPNDGPEAAQGRDRADHDAQCLRHRPQQQGGRALRH